MKFDSRGYLQPPKRHEFMIKELESLFVTDFPTSKTRQILFDRYLKYTNDFRDVITENIVQWIGGSFTTKKENPRDIDLVTILDYQNFEEHKELIDSKFRFKNGLDKYGVDGYSIPKYPMEDSRYPITEGALVYWDRQFSASRPNRAKKVFSRGYVEIIFKAII